MQRSVRLRPWQREALDAFEANPEPDFLAVATPGAGKTTFALAAAARHLERHPARKVIVVAPTAHLKVQWAGNASRFGIHLEPQWSPREGALARDMHGAVVTYQQVAMHPTSLRHVTRDAFTIFDEVHHAGDDKAWGDGIRLAFEGSARRLSLSGTPFRSDSSTIPFVHYDDFGEAHSDYEYGYGEALVDGNVVRPVYFPRIDGEMEWTGPDGEHYFHTFDDELDRVRSGQRLRTALAVTGEWLPAVIDQAHAQLLAIRAVEPDAGGLIIAMDQEHARGIVTLLRKRFGIAPLLSLSDDPEASHRIQDFAAGTMPWLVAVRMVSEGVDIPRLRVGVFATNTATELFFRQAAGRLVRWTPGVAHQNAFFFIPDDPRLRYYAAEIATQRRHSLRRREEDPDARPEGELDEREVDAEPPEDEQLSLFSALSAVVIGEPHTVEHPPAPSSAPSFGIPDHVVDPEDGFTVVLTVPARPGGVNTPATGPDAGLTRPQRKARLRGENADRARDIARAAGITHALVNGELNRLAGVTKVSEATEEQLERRLAHATTWLTKIR